VNPLHNDEPAPNLLRRSARWIVLSAVIISPWLFGSAEPWAYLLVSAIANVGVIVWLFSLLRHGQFNRNALGPALAGLALMAFLLLQTVPLPAGLVKTVSPLSAEVQTTRDNILGKLNAPATADSLPGPCTLSVSPAATRQSLFLLASYLGVFLVMAHTTTGWRSLRRAGVALVISGFLMAVFALIQSFTGTRTIYWFHRPRMGGTIFGPFNNRNHFAAYMNMMLGLTLALLPLRSRSFSAYGPQTWRETISQLSIKEINQAILLGFAAIIMGSAVFLSLSRGAITSLVAGLGILGVFMTFQTRGIDPRRLIGTMILFIVAVVIWLGWQPVAERLGSLAILATEPLSGSRLAAALATLRMWGAFLFTGCGFGCFQYAFSIFQGPSLQVGRFLHAHNDYAQLLSEGGIVGAALALLVFALLIRTVLKNFSSSSHDARFFIAGLTVSIATITIHSLVDFSLHKPANAFLLAALCGMAVAAVSLPRKSSRDDAVYGPDYGTGSSAARIAAAAGLFLMSLLTLATLAEMRSELAFARFIQWQKIAERTEEFQYRSAAIETTCAEADRIIQAGSSDADVLIEVTMNSLWQAADRNLDPELRIRLSEQAASAATEAARTAPADYECWLWLARAELVLGKPALARLCFGRAQDLAPPGMMLERMPPTRGEK
jgi:hypothetical protein